ncbi:MAG: hypothetical protein QW803_13145, partial [Candidatus Methanomethylicia archaeon]
MARMLRCFKLEEVFSVSISVMVFFTLLYLVNVFKPIIYPTINRVTIPRRVAIYFMDQYFDLLILLSSSVVTVIILLYLSPHKHRMML